MNSGEYSQAYKPGIYRDTFKELWVREHLAFLGFGFNDPQFTFMVKEFLRDLGDANAVPRHVAILGLPVEKDGRLTDTEAVREWRENLEADYHSVRSSTPCPTAITRRSRSSWNTSRSAVALPGSLAPRRPSRRSQRRRLPFPPSGSTRPATTRSSPAATTRLPGSIAGCAMPRCASSASLPWAARVVRAHRPLAQADRRLAEPPVCRAVRVELLSGARYRKISRSVPRMGTRDVPHTEANADTKLVATALATLRRHPLVLVLDGLEVLQEGPGDSRYGSFLDGDLRELLAAFCHRDHESLAVLTSRFVFADLDRFLGTAFHQLELHGLAPDNGARLIEELGVRGPPAEREHVSEELDGHPLGLRVVADALPEEDCDQPRQFLDESFRVGALPEGASLNDKLRRLLVFYEKKLPEVQVRILGIVSLFRAPIADETVLRLVRGVFGEALPDDATLSTELRRLQSRGILTREPIEGGQGSACHPILRDHFRAVLLGTGADTAHRAADLLTGQPSEERPRSVKEIEPVLLAIELLLDAGDFKAADALYRNRLENGNVFKWIPALGGRPRLRARLRAG